MPRIAPRALHIYKIIQGEHFQGDVATHKYSHLHISNPRFTNPIYTHVMTAL